MPSSGSYRLASVCSFGGSAGGGDSVSPLPLQSIIPKKADGIWGSAAAAADAAVNVPDSIFSTRGPQQVISLRDFIATLLDVFVARFL